MQNWPSGKAVILVCLQTRAGMSRAWARGLTEAGCFVHTRERLNPGHRATLLFEDEGTEMVVHVQVCHVLGGLLPGVVVRFVSWEAEADSGSGLPT